MIEELLEIVERAKQHLKQKSFEKKSSKPSAQPLLKKEDPPLASPLSTNQPPIKKTPFKKGIAPSSPIPKSLKTPLPPPVKKELSDLISWYQTSFPKRPLHLIPLSDDAAKKVKTAYQKSYDYLILLPNSLICHPFYLKLNESIDRLIAPSKILAIEATTDQDLQNIKRILIDKEAFKQTKTWARHIHKNPTTSRLSLFNAELIPLDPLPLLATPEKKKALWQFLSSSSNSH